MNAKGVEKTGDDVNVAMSNQILGKDIFYDSGVFACRLESDVANILFASFFGTQECGPVQQDI